VNILVASGGKLDFFVLSY